jgi:hypothetical protein
VPHDRSYGPAIPRLGTKARKKDVDAREDGVPAAKTRRGVIAQARRREGDSNSSERALVGIEGSAQPRQPEPCSRRRVGFSVRQALQHPEPVIELR